MRRIVTKNDENGNSFIISDAITNIEIPFPDRIRKKNRY